MGSSLLTIHNPWGLKIRTDKAVAEICQVSRSKVRQLIKEGKLELPQDYVGSRIVLELGGCPIPENRDSESHGIHGQTFERGR
jgi:hypothetical protein